MTDNMNGSQPTSAHADKNNCLSPYGGPVKIGGVEFENPYFLAPLAGITDAPFRRICRSFGAGAVYSEMISAKGLYYNDKVTEKLLTLYDDELPVVYQIFGSDPVGVVIRGRCTVRQKKLHDRYKYGLPRSESGKRR